MQELQGLSLDWAEIKKVLGAADDALELVCNSLPAGLAKSIVCGVASGLKLVISLLPNSEAAK